MKHLTDDELLGELIIRFEENDKLMKELKQVNKKLKDSEVLKSQFLSNIRNEINNPFAAIMGLSQNIQRMGKDEFELMKKTASMIFYEAFKLDYQLKNIFAAAELEAGEVFPEVYEVDMHLLVQEVMGKFRHKAEEKQIEVWFSYNEEEYVIDDRKLLFSTDAEIVNLILSNLLCNAIEFSAPGSIVHFSITRLSGGISIEVKDNGIGVAQSEQEIIFDRFVQIDQGSSKNFQGHGLGLSVAKSLTEILNGSLSLESEINKGSKFLLYLPETEQLNEESFSTNEDGIFL